MSGLQKMVDMFLVERIHLWKRLDLHFITIKKYSVATSGENNPRALQVYCPQLKEVFNCIKYASDKYRVNRGSISLCIKGKLKSAGKHPITGEKLTWELIEKWY